MGDVGELGCQTETVVRLDVAGGYRSPALYVAAIVRVISHLHPQASHGRLVLLGVGGASLFHELLKQNFAQFQVRACGRRERADEGGH